MARADHARGSRSRIQLAVADGSSAAKRAHLQLALRLQFNHLLLAGIRAVGLLLVGRRQVRLRLRRPHIIVLGDLLRARAHAAAAAAARRPSATRTRQPTSEREPLQPWASPRALGHTRGRTRALLPTAHAPPIGPRMRGGARHARAPCGARRLHTLALALACSRREHVVQQSSRPPATLHVHAAARAASGASGLGACARARATTPPQRVPARGRASAPACAQSRRVSASTPNRPAGSAPTHTSTARESQPSRNGWAAAGATLAPLGFLALVQRQQPTEGHNLLVYTCTVGRAWQ